MSVYHEVIEALLPLIQAFDQLGISYYIGGSVSSSLHGLPRRTQDVDVIVDIPPAQVHSLFQLLQSEYYSTSKPSMIRFDAVFPITSFISRP